MPLVDDETGIYLADLKMNLRAGRFLPINCMVVEGDNVVIANGTALEAHHLNDRKVESELKKSHPLPAERDMKRLRWRYEIFHASRTSIEGIARIRSDFVVYGEHRMAVVYDHEVTTTAIIPKQRISKLDDYITTMKDCSVKDRKQMTVLLRTKGILLMSVEYTEVTVTTFTVLQRIPALNTFPIVGSTICNASWEKLTCVFGSSDGTVYCWRPTQPEKIVQSVKTEMGLVFAMTSTPFGFVAVGENRSVTVLHLANLSIRDTQIKHLTRPTTVLSVDGRGLVATGAEDGEVILWNVHMDGTLASKSRINLRLGIVRSMVVCAGYLFVGSSSGSVAGVHLELQNDPMIGALTCTTRLVRRFSMCMVAGRLDFFLLYMDGELCFQAEDGEQVIFEQGSMSDVMCRRLRNGSVIFAWNSTTIRYTAAFDAIGHYTYGPNTWETFVVPEKILNVIMDKVIILVQMTKGRMMMTSFLEYFMDLPSYFSLPTINSRLAREDMIITCMTCTYSVDGDDNKGARVIVGTSTGIILIIRADKYVKEMTKVDDGMVDVIVESYFLPLHESPLFDQPIAFFRPFDFRFYPVLGMTRNGHEFTFTLFKDNTWRIDVLGKSSTSLDITTAYAIRGEDFLIMGFSGMNYVVMDYLSGVRVFEVHCGGFIKDHDCRFFDSEASFYYLKKGLLVENKCFIKNYNRRVLRKNPHRCKITFIRAVQHRRFHWTMIAGSLDGQVSAFASDEMYGTLCCASRIPCMSELLAGDIALDGDVVYVMAGGSKGVVHPLRFSVTQSLFYRTKPVVLGETKVMNVSFGVEVSPLLPGTLPCVIAFADATICVCRVRLCPPVFEDQVITIQHRLSWPGTKSVFNAVISVALRENASQNFYAFVCATSSCGKLLMWSDHWHVPDWEKTPRLLDLDNSSLTAFHRIHQYGLVGTDSGKLIAFPYDELKMLPIRTTKIVAHASQITAIECASFHNQDNWYLVFSIGLDCRLTMHTYKPMEGVLELSYRVISLINDPSYIVLSPFAVNDPYDKMLVLVAGVGLETITLSRRRLQYVPYLESDQKIVQLDPDQPFDPSKQDQDEFPVQFVNPAPKKGNKKKRK